MLFYIIISFKSDLKTLYYSMPHKYKKSIGLYSSFTQLERLEPYVKELQIWAGFDEKDLRRIMLTLSEAVTNAIKHGNEEDPNKQVSITARLGDAKNKLTICVQDEGSGFNPKIIPDPLKKENIMKKGGRGIFLIAHYADDYHYSNQGAKITLIYNI